MHVLISYSVMVGFWQLHHALTQIWHLKQSLLYLIG